MLESGVEHPAVNALHENLVFVGAVNQVPWLVPVLSAIPGAAESYKKFVGWCGEELRERKEVIVLGELMTFPRATAADGCPRYSIERSRQWATKTPRISYPGSLRLPTKATPRPPTRKRGGRRRLVS